MSSWYIPPPTGQLQRQGRNRRLPYPSYQYDMSDNIYPDFYYPRVFDPWATARFTPSGRARGRRDTVEGGRFVDEHNDPDASMAEMVNGRSARDFPVTTSFNDGVRPDGANNTVSFKVSLDKLHRQLVASATFCQRFKTEYDTEVARIQRYASAETLLEVWREKLEGNSRQHVAADQPGNDDELIEMADRFKVMKEKLRTALEEASLSTLERPKGRDKEDNIEYRYLQRSKELVGMAQKQFPRLVGDATKTPEDCQELSKELGRFRDLFNPNRRHQEDGDVGVDAANTGDEGNDNGWAQ